MELAIWLLPIKRLVMFALPTKLKLVIELTTQFKDCNKGQLVTLSAVRLFSEQFNEISAVLFDTSSDESWLV
jgi:hypothetical protein